MSWVLGNGPVPEGLYVLHRCDTPPCVRLSHLFTGTPKDNTRDMIAKRRWGYPAARGERNARAKVTEEQVIAIRERFAAGELRQVLAAEYGLTPARIGDILNGRSWRHVGGPIRPAAQIGRRRAGDEANREPVCVSCGRRCKNQGCTSCGRCHESTRIGGTPDRLPAERGQKAA